MISNIIHFNRDENSFTARLFERLIIKFESDQAYFNRFLSDVEKAGNSNKLYLKNETLKEIVFSKMRYIDAMPFVENIDLYSYCITNKIAIDIDNADIDKTEFDYIIIAEDQNKKQLVFVFEVKCFSDYDKEEIIRQNELLRKYKAAGLFDDFFHIALISYENLKNGREIRTPLPSSTYNHSIITWEDIKGFIDTKRIKSEIEFSQLYKTIHLDGTTETKRFLIKK